MSLINYSHTYLTSIANCISGVLYATILHSERNKSLLDAALNTFLTTLEKEEPHSALLYKLYYEQKADGVGGSTEASLDLAFNDGILDDVETLWKSVMGDEVDSTNFMRFQDREGMSNDDDEDIDEGY
jgi:hypothetical protein